MVGNPRVVHFKQVGLWWEVWWTYDPVLVSIVKALPYTQREWLPDARHWRVSQMSVRRLAMDVTEAGYVVDGLELDTHNWLPRVENRWRTPFRKDIDG